MTSSLDARRRTPPRPEGPRVLTAAPAVVRVLISGRSRRALCRCGWVGCQLAVPLVDVDIGRPP